MSEERFSEIAAMKRMPENELQAKCADVFGEATKARHKEWLVRRIAWRMQPLAEGAISERARQRAAETGGHKLRFAYTVQLLPAGQAIHRIS
jgi:hypothetical protein